MSEAASLFASLSLRVDGSSFGKGDAAIAGAKRSIDALDGAFQDRGGRWRVASGRLLTIGETARLAATGVRGLGDEAEKAGGKAGRAGKNGAGAFDGIGKSAKEAVARVQSVAAAAGALAIWFGGRAAVKAGVEFNATLEESQVKIAGMLAVAKKSHFADEVGAADTLMANLSRRAATLPGSTAEYVSMLGNIAQPVIDAGLSMQALEDITVGATVAAKAFGVDAEAGARDIDQALQGQFHSVDRLTGKALATAGFKGEEGRARFNALPQAQRAQELSKAFNTPQIKELAEAQGNTFKGMFSTLADAWDRFQGAVTKPIFAALKESVKDLNAWLDANKEKVKEVADQIGGVLLTAFNVIGSAINFFIEHGEFAKSLLIAIGIVLAGLAIAWLAGFWPIFAIIAAVTALVYGFRKLLTYPGGIKQAFRDAFNAIVDAVKAVGRAIRDAFSAAFDFVADLPVIHQLIWLVKKLTGIGGTGVDESKHAGLTPEQVDALPSGELNYIEQIGRLGRPDQFIAGRSAPSLPPASASGGTSIGDVTIPITVNSNSADPKAVATETRKAFDEHFNSRMRKAMDAQ